MRDVQGMYFYGNAVQSRMFQSQASMFLIALILSLLIHHQISTPQAPLVNTMKSNNPFSNSRPQLQRTSTNPNFPSKLITKPIPPFAHSPRLRSTKSNDTLSKKASEYGLDFKEAFRKEAFKELRWKVPQGDAEESTAGGGTVSPDVGNRERRTAGAFDTAERDKSPGGRTWVLKEGKWTKERVE